MSNYNKSGRRGFRNFKQNKNHENKNETTGDQLNPIILSFKKYSKELDDKHDRYERIVKLGRDITIESKRIIFLLHTIDPKKDNTEKVLDEAKKRLQILCSVNFLAIAKEIGTLDQYQYARAYSPGLQEFVEAFTFYEYLSKQKYSDWNDLQKKLQYDVVDDKIEKPSVGLQEKNDEEKTENNKDEIEGVVNDEEINNKLSSMMVAVATKNETDNMESTVAEENAENASKTVKFSCHVQPIEFICGLADVGGEIMRRCINSLGSGDIETCFESCRSLQELYPGYLGINNARSRELSRKTYTLRQSVLKTENVCYNVKVRGGEAAKWGSTTDVFSDKHFDDDEGFF